MPVSPSAAFGTVLVLGSSDLAGLGDQLMSRVVAQQLSRRLPGWRCVARAPLGRTRPAVTDGGIGALPLPGHDHASVARIARSGQFSVVCPTFPVGISGAELADRYGVPAVADTAPWFGDGPAAGHPTCWTAVRVADVSAELAAAAGRQPLLAVRDRQSRDRLRAAGVEAEIAVVAHPGLLAAALVEPDTLADRRQVLRQLGLLPDGGYVVLHLTTEAPAGLADALDAVRAAAGVDQIVVLPDFPDLWPERHLPADLVLADRLAVLSGATAVVATDEHGAAASAGLGVRWVLLDPDGHDRPAALEFGWANQIADQPAGLARAFRSSDDGERHKDHSITALVGFLDQLAALAAEVAAASPAAERHLADLAEENAALWAANARLRERVLLERQRLAEPLVVALSTRDDALSRIAELTEADRALRAELAVARRELATWRGTKLVRWSAPLREVYGKIRKP